MSFTSLHNNVLTNPMSLPFFLSDMFDSNVDKEAPRKKASWRILRHEKEAVLEVELPGLGKEEVVVEIKEGRLRIEGRRLMETAVSGGEKENGREVQDGEDEEKVQEETGFKARWRVGRDVDVDKIEVAEFKNGLMKVRLPFRETPTPRKLSIC